MKDVLDRELKLGDDVVFAHSSYGNGYYLHKGKIVDFTPKMIRINFIVEGQCYRAGLSEETIKTPSKVVKVTL